ncbi:hypothetical protein GCM10010492_19890 [Saccharothrix mutabilis subsp. mutabilis]|uniref:PEP-utilising enzyme mobile domain-containing protein n=1 Tax=Saccharothrix mutabilis subsp. mutabilis TaxID=66855 RepID=A0ABP3D6X0_9PSEU
MSVAGPPGPRGTDGARRLPRDDGRVRAGRAGGTTGNIGGRLAARTSRTPPRAHAPASDAITGFPGTAAVVTDVGAPLSHGAIVARELGIPAVVGCGNATSRISTGDRVRVDGGRSAGTPL